MLLNERYYAPKAAFLAEIRREKHLWRLPPLGREA